METKTAIPDFSIRDATEKDIPLILQFIQELAMYERLSHEVVATEASLRETLFGENRYAEVIFGYYKKDPVAFSVFYHNYSTFLGRPGIYLEDFFVKADMRGKGFGREMLAYLARLAKKRRCGRLEWWVLDWNEPSIKFYKSLGALPMNEWTVFRVAGEALDKLAEK